MNFLFDRSIPLKIGELKIKRLLFGLAIRGLRVAIVAI